MANEESKVSFTGDQSDKSDPEYSKQEYDGLISSWNCSVADD